VKELTKFGVDASESAMKAMQGRMCDPEEVAQAALYLVSDEASFVNGSALYVDNAFTAI
jgi:NAD(P)-dependent dehydrogenase (short-subunit alcohol dehydrogenase family)